MSDPNWRDHLKQGKTPVPITDADGNVIFGSIKEGAAALGVPYRVLRHHWAKYKTLEGLAPGKNAVIVRYSGKVWPSIAAFCKEKGCSRSNVLRTLERDGHLENIRFGKGTARKGAKKLNIGGYRFKSIAEAARKIDVGESKLRWWLKHPHLHYKILEAIMKYEQKLWKERQ